MGILFACFLIGFGGYYTLGGLKGPPSKENLIKVAGTIKDIVIHTETEKEKENKRYMVIELNDDKGSFRYDQDQPGFQDMTTFEENGPIEMLIDNRFTNTDIDLEIWQLRIGDDVLSTYETNLATVNHAGTAKLIVGSFLLLIGIWFAKDMITAAKQRSKQDSERQKE